MLFPRGPAADQVAYTALRACLQRTFHPARRLPAHVYRVPGSTLCCEFEAVLATDFWPALAALARLHGDPQVLLVTVEPDPDAYYRPEFGTWAAFALDVDATPDDYWELLAEHPGDDHGTVYFASETIMIAGASGRWGCWAERGPGVATFRSDLGAEFDHWAQLFAPFMSPEEALSDIVAWNFRDNRLPVGFAAEFLANY